jgi:CheY-like chemotaxis protein
VIDDRLDVAESLAMLLGVFARDVRIGQSGPEALDLVRSFRPEAIFLDIGLPGMDGYEIARRLRQEPGFKNSLLVAVSGYGLEEDRRRSREAGFDYHLVKPVSLRDLQRVFHRTELTAS